MVCVCVYYISTEYLCLLSISIRFENDNEW